MKILFVCTGNTCRSPLAAALSLAMLRRLPAPPAEVAVASAGIYAEVGATASAGALAVAEEKGLSLADHRAQQLTAAHVAAADEIYTMTAAQARQLQAQFPEAADRIRALADRDVRDPFGGDLAAYRQAYEDIDAALKPLLQRFEKGEGK